MKKTKRSSTIDFNGDRTKLLNNWTETLKSTNRLLKHCISVELDFKKIPLDDISKSDHTLSKEMIKLKHR